MIHEHTCEPRGSSTLARDTVRYAPPFERLVHRWLVRPDIERIFLFRAEALRRRFATEQPTAP
jgi:ligand-binding SRPBCC domain-containing protein